MRAGIGLHIIDVASYQTSGGAFKPSSLFGDTDAGGFYDPSDLTSMFDRIPNVVNSPPSAVSVGDSVGIVCDKSQLGGMSLREYAEANNLAGTESSLTINDLGGSDGAFVDNGDGTYTVSNTTQSSSSYPRFNWLNTLTVGAYYYVAFKIQVNSGDDFTHGQWCVGASSSDSETYRAQVNGFTADGWGNGRTRYPIPSNCHRDGDGYG